MVGSLLAQTAVNLALSSAKSTSTLINSLLNSATNPMQKEEYKTCLEVYGDAADELNQCKTLLASKDFGGANVNHGITIYKFPLMNSTGKSSLVLSAKLSFLETFIDCGSVTKLQNTEAVNRISHRTNI